MARVVFEMPKDFAAPEGVGTGETFDAVCTFRMEEGGQVCLTKMGDADMYDKEDKAPDYKGYAKNVMKARDEPVQSNSAY